ncbi:MAG: type II secretion system F family protein [Alphaproteobacteria bacterium]|nr:type II secretion system F family protein [Alphaproteobacteria bacterium]
MSALFSMQSLSSDIVIVVVGLATFLTVMLFYRALLVRDPLAARMKTLSERREALCGAILAPRRRGKRDVSMGTVRGVVRRLNLLRSDQAKKAGLKLVQAGWRSKDALAVYFFCKLCFPFVFGGLILLFIATDGFSQQTDTMRILIALIGIIAGAYAPDIFIKNAITKRRQKMLRGLPDALDLLVICSEAGQRLDGSLARVSREIGVSCPELAEELTLTSIELNLLPDRREALDNLNKRVDLAELRGVVNALL